MLIWFLIIALTFVAVFAVLEMLGAGRRQVSVSLRRARTYGGYSLREAELGRGVGDRILAPSIQRLARIALRVTPKGNIEDVRRKLHAAGMLNVPPTTFLAVKAGLAGSLLLLGAIMLLTGAKDPVPALLIGVGGAAACFLLPDTYLTMKQRGRKEALVAQMPNVLDLLTVSVEAGLGFDAALAKVCERVDGPLIDECRIMLHEMRIGETRQKALRNMAERCDAPEVNTLTRSIIQADQLGISLSRILRVQAQDIRNRRQMQAEERAMKAPVKMLFPTAVFIFPAMFIVALGPAMIQLLELFS